MEMRAGEAAPERRPLTVGSRPTDDGVVVEVSGDLDFETADALHDLIGGLALRPGQRLAVDLGAVDFFDSSVLGALLAAHALARQSEAALELVAPPDHILRVLDAVGLTEYFATSPAERR